MNRGARAGWRDTAPAMSEKNIEAVRRVYAQWATGDFRTGLTLYDPHVVLVQPPDLPESGVYVGLDGIRRLGEGDDRGTGDPRGWR